MNQGDIVKRLQKTDKWLTPAEISGRKKNSNLCRQLTKLCEIGILKKKFVGKINSNKRKYVYQL